MKKEDQIKLENVKGREEFQFLFRVPPKDEISSEDGASTSPEDGAGGKFLDELYESKRVDMRGAVPYLQEKFPELTRSEAKKILDDWIKQHGGKY